MNLYMTLNSGPFALIKEGRKTIELRLFDEKRRCVKVGDVIVFQKKEDPEQKLFAKVLALHQFPDFSSLYKSLPLEKCGYSEDEIETASPEDMKKYYSPEKQEKYGVLGIEFALIDNEE